LKDFYSLRRMKKVLQVRTLVTPILRFAILRSGIFLESDITSHSKSEATVSCDFQGARD